MTRAAHTAACSDSTTSTPVGCCTRSPICSMSSARSTSPVTAQRSCPLQRRNSGAEPMKLVGVGISTRARVERYPDFLEDFFRALDSAVEFPRVSHHEIHDEGALPFLG